MSIPFTVGIRCRFSRIEKMAGCINIPYSLLSGPYS